MRLGRAIALAALWWAYLRPGHATASSVGVHNTLSGVNLRAVAEVETDRLHDVERGALGEHICGRDHAGVLLDHGRGCRGGDLVQVALQRGPDVLAIFEK